MDMTPHVGLRNTAKVCLVLGLAACGGGDGPTPPSGTDVGAITVSVATSGTNPDVDGYTVVVDAGTPQTIAPGATSITIPDVAVGARTVTLGGEGQGCTIAPAAAQTVTVTAGATATVPFTVTCGAPPGNTTGRIVFASDETGNLDVYIMNGDGTGKRALTTTGGDDDQPVLSQNGARIAFRRSDGGPSRIIIIDTLGTPLDSLASTSGRFLSQPALSPDGQKLAFRRADSASATSPSLIRTADLVSGVQRTIAGTTIEPLDTVAHTPSWSADGLRLAFSSGSNLNALQLVTTDTLGGTRNLPASGLPAGATPLRPSWSPTGQTIVFDALVGGARAIFTTTDGAASPAQPLTSNGGVNDTGSDWSPDGTQIVFVSNRTGNADLFIMNADGSNQTPLTTGSNADVDPTWEP